MATRDERTRFHLLDAAALIVGYALASMLVRAYWPASEPLEVWAILMFGLVYTWLGLAMSGPIVLLIRRPPAAAPAPGDEPLAEPRTWAEIAWLIIGFYWIGLTLIVVPVRMNGAHVLDTAVLGVFPIVAALGLRFFGPRDAVGQGDKSLWTHRAGVALLLSWPFAWLGLIVLGKNLI